MEGASGRVFRFARLSLSGVAVAAAVACLAAPAQAAPGDIFTFAGSGTAAFGGDGGAAGAAALHSPTDVEWLADGSVLVADFRNHRIRRISPGGTITTIAGTGSAGHSGDGGPATAARLNSPTDVDPTADGGFLIADLGNRRVRKVSASGTITTVAGNGQEGSGGDGGRATSARIDAPAGVAAIADGGFLVSDAGGDRVRAVSPGGTITTVAGGGGDGSNDEGGPATSAVLAAPVGLAPLPGGGFLVAEYEGNRVRRVWPNGTITRVAGTGSTGSGGDGGPATSARLNHPVGVSATADGGFLIADSFNGRVRKVTAQGVIGTLAGGPQSGFAGDGGPASAARLDYPTQAVENPHGAVLIADAGNNRVRVIEGAPPAAWSPPPASPPPANLLVKPKGGELRATRSGAVRLQVGCPLDSGERCRGTIVLRLKGQGGKARASGALVIARARFSVAPGNKRAVKLRLTKRGRRMLRRRRALTIEAVATRRGGPNIGEKSERVTLKLKRKRKRTRGHTAGGGR